MQRVVMAWMREPDTPGGFRDSMPCKAVSNSATAEDMAKMADEGIAIQRDRVNQYSSRQVSAIERRSPIYILCPARASPRSQGHYAMRCYDGRWWWGGSRFSRATLVWIDYCCQRARCPDVVSPQTENRVEWTLQFAVWKSSSRRSRCDYKENDRRLLYARYLHSQILDGGGWGWKAGWRRWLRWGVPNCKGRRLKGRAVKDSPHHVTKSVVWVVQRRWKETVIIGGK